MFGYFLCGPIAKNPTKRISSFSARFSVTESQLDGIHTKFWEVEDVPVKPGKESSSVCEDNFQQTTTRDKEERYVVFLPFKELNKISLGHSRSIALAQFLRKEVRLSKNAP